jgi:beta-aspartyl-peptidase (threonine type)
MRLFRPCLGIFLVLSLFSLCEAAGTEPAASVRAVLDQQVSAWNAGDLDRFLETYWKSGELTFFSGGTITRGWQATRERYRKRYLSSGDEMGHLTFSDISVQMLGDSGALAKGRWLLQRSGKPDLSGLFSLTIRRFPEGWRIIHDHTSIAE